MLLGLVQLSGKQLSLSEHRRGESGATNGARPVSGGSELAREPSDLLIWLGAVQRELDEAQVRVEDRASESWVPSRVEHVAAHAVPELTPAVAHHAEKPGRLGRDANESDVAGQTACLLRRGLCGGEIFVVPGDESTSEKERRSVTGSRRFYAVQRCLCRGCVARREVCARLADPKFSNSPRRKPVAFNSLMSCASSAPVSVAIAFVSTITDSKQTKSAR